MTTQVAAAVRERRQDAGLSLRALAAVSGVSSSMISDIERGAKSPTISTLAAIADALGVSLSTFVGTVPDARKRRRLRVVRASKRRLVVDPATGAERDDFGSSPVGSRVEFMRYKVPPRVLAGPFQPHASGTIEHVHLATGRIGLMLGTATAWLEAGDSCSCLADVTHGFDNREGEEEAVIYLVIEHQG